MDPQPLNQPLKINQNLTLYSGDLITLNDSEPLLIELVTESPNSPPTAVKLRTVKKASYLSKKANFDTKFTKKALLLKWEIQALDSESDSEWALVWKDEKGKDRYLSHRKGHLRGDKDHFSFTNEKTFLEIIKVTFYSEKIAGYHENVDFDSVSGIIEQASQASIIKKYNHTDYFHNTSEREITRKFSSAEKFIESKSLNINESNNFQFMVNANLEIPYAGGVGVSWQWNKEKSSGTSFSYSKEKDMSVEIEVPCPPSTYTYLVVTTEERELPCLVKVIRRIGASEYHYTLEGHYKSVEVRTSVSSEVRNILLVGWTGSGKSTLANVLTNTDSFQEGASAAGVTQTSEQSEIFPYKEKYYRIIDNIGFGDPDQELELEKDQVLENIGRAIVNAPEGLGRVLLVYNGRLDERHLKAFQRTKALIEKSGILHYTTLVCTKFEDFEDPIICRQEQAALIKELEVKLRYLDVKAKKAKEIVEELRLVIKRSILFVNNSLTTNRTPEVAELAKADRKTSRAIVLDHLHVVCNREPYKLASWDEIGRAINKEAEIAKYLQSRKLNEQAIEQAEADIKQAVAKIFEENILPEDDFSLEMIASLNK